MSLLRRQSLSEISYLEQALTQRGSTNSQSRSKTKASLVFRAGHTHLKMMFNVPRAPLRREPALPPGSKPELDFPGDQI